MLRYVLLGIILLNSIGITTVYAEERIANINIEELYKKYSVIDKRVITIDPELLGRILVPINSPEISFTLTETGDSLISAGQFFQMTTNLQIVSGNEETMNVVLTCEIEYKGRNIGCDQPQELTIRKSSPTSAVVRIDTEETTKPGKYDSKLIVNYGSIEKEKIVIPIEVTAVDPKVGFTTSNDRDVNSPIQFTSTLEDPSKIIKRLEWDFGDGKKSSGQKATHSYEEEGPHLVILNAFDGDGKSYSYQETIEIKGLAAPWWLAIVGTVGGLLIGLLKLFSSRKKSQTSKSNDKSKWH